jgi:SH3-like domain-containing protein
MRILLLALLCILVSFSPAFAEDDPKEGTGLPLPRFASLKSDSVFARTGPSMDYPIRWIYKREGLPVEIIQEFDVWRKIKDPSGETAWVHKILLSGQRTAIIGAKDPVTAWSKQDGTHPVAKLEPNVIAMVAECEKEFCKLELVPFEGWVAKKYLWGVYPSEILN